MSKKTTFTDPRLAFAVEASSFEGHISKYTVKQKYDASSKPAQILLGRDLSKKFAIVTGANCGLGNYRVVVMYVWSRVCQCAVALSR